MMKRIMLITLSLVMATALVACGSATAPSQTTTSSNITTYTALVEPFIWPDLEHLVAGSDVILIATVEQALPPVRVDFVAEGLVNRKEPDFRNISSFVLSIEQVIAGDLAVNDPLRLDLNGGLADNIDEIYIDVPMLEAGKTYLFFLERSSRPESTNYFKYRRADTLQGFIEIVDDQLFPVQHAPVFTAGEDVAAALDRIRNVMQVVPAD